MVLVGTTSVEKSERLSVFSQQLRARAGLFTVNWNAFVSTSAS